MNYLKKLLKALSISLIILILGLILVTLLSYLSEGFIYKTVKVILPLLAIFIGSINLGKNSKEKGWFEGIKLGLIYIFIFLILNIIFTNDSINYKQIIYYLIILFISSFGGMMGISKDVDKK